MLYSKPSPYSNDIMYFLKICFFDGILECGMFPAEIENWLLVSKSRIVIEFQVLTQPKSQGNWINQFSTDNYVQLSWTNEAGFDTSQIKPRVHLINYLTISCAKVQRT